MIRSDTQEAVDSASMYSALGIKYGIWRVLSNLIARRFDLSTEVAGVLLRRLTRRELEALNDDLVSVQSLDELWSLLMSQISLKDAK